MRLASLAFALLALATLGACDRRAPAPPAPPAPPSTPEPILSARRPTRRYYLARTADRCEVYSVDPAGSRPPSPTPCPPELRVGERIRIAGKTCFRESDDARRVEPVVCPDPLTNLEKKDLGERHD